MANPKKIAGGRATETGMGFQAAVATWFASHLLADMPIGAQFGLPADVAIASLQCETGDALDDVVVRLNGGGAIYTQCKTRPTLASSEDSLLAKALEQLMGLHIQLGRAALPANPSVALLAVAQDAASSLNTLEAACRMFDHGGTWSAVLAQVPNDKRRALTLFEAHLRTASGKHPTQTLVDDDLVAMARLFRVHRFPEDETEAAWRNLSHLIGRRVFGGDHAGDGPLNALLGLSRKLIRTGAPVDRDGLLRALRAEGYVDVSAPAYDKDIKAFETYSNDQRKRLQKHTRLSLGAGIPIPRDCLDPLLAAIEHGSLLVTGEPGAGKTGVLMALAERRSTSPGPVVFLSVDLFSGFRNRSDFQHELKIDHDPLEVLAAWPGPQPGVLIIDALDASRGGPSESLIAAFVAEAVEKLGARWSIIASIRSFDLRNGRRFRDVMPGAPPDRAFCENGLDNVRHFHVPRLTSGELAGVSAASPSLSELETTAPPKLRELLRNIFNLSLAAELLNSGVGAQTIRTVATQSELISRYENVRLDSQPLRLAVRATLALMVSRRQLSVRAIDVENNAVDDVCKAGVLVSSDDKVTFAHHVLFDHLAGRFFLAWDDTKALRAQVSGDPSIAFILGPALRFALELIWQDGPAGPANTWRFLADLASMQEPDPIVMSIALRTAAERVEAPNDVSGLCSLIVNNADVRSAARLVSQLARFVSVAIEERGHYLDTAALAWATVARAAATRSNPYLADAARVVLMTLAEKANFDDADFAAMFGEAARSLLGIAWSLNPENSALATTAIRFVTKSYGSDPTASRMLLERILGDRLEQHASDEAQWLAEGVRSIIPHDPDFVALIYSTLFGHDVTDEQKTWIGGSASRILPLTSTRKQDYQHARWQLNEALRAFLDVSSVGGTTAVVGAVRGLAAEKRRSTEDWQKPIEVNIEDRIVRVIDDGLSFQDWRLADTHQERPLSAFAEFLQSCPRDAFRDAVTTTSALPANASVWARILGVAAVRPGMAEDLLWPLAVDPYFTSLPGLARDAIIFLAATLQTRSVEERTAFEKLALVDNLFPEERQARWWRSVLKRLFSVVPRDALVTPEMIALRDEMETAGDLTGNRPFVSIEVGWGSRDNIVDSLLRSDGADLERSPDREIRAASRKVEDHIKIAPGSDTVSDLVALWQDIEDLVEILDEKAGEGPHPQLAHSSWGAVCNGVERLAKSAAYAPGATGLPNLVALLALIDRLSASPYPDVAEKPSDLMGWGNWDVRVYAASSLVALAPRFAGERSDIVDRMQACLRDLAPTVRLQVAQAINVLWDVAHDRMWSLVTEIVEDETHQGVLSVFISGPMWPLSRENPGRCASLLSKLLKREWATTTGGERGRGERDAEASANLTAFLYVAHDQPEAWAWLDRWGADLRRGETYLSPMLHNLRQVFFFPYGEAPKPDELAMTRRARRLLDVIVSSASGALTEARPYLLGTPTDSAVATWRPLYVAADNLIDQVCNQLYFGSGAFRTSGDGEARPGLKTASDKQRFLADYSTVLDAIALHAQARTVHNLFALLSYLVEGDPIGVFERISNILLGPAAADGYQFEVLGVDSLVKLVRRYLADHRDIFDDADRRQALVKVLETFSSVGWPEALKLLFELPDLLR